MLKKIVFDDFVRLGRGFDLPDNKIVEGEYPVVASTNIKAFHCEYKVDPPVVVTGRSGSLGKVQYVTSKCWPLNTALYSKDCRSNVPQYIYYYLQTMHLEQYNAGAGVPTLNQNHLQRLKILVHEPSEQTIVASILAAYDNLIENNNKRIKILEQMAENLYKEWFVRFRFPDYQNSEFENGIPKGWNVVKIKKCVKRLAFNRLYKENELEKEGNVIVIDQSANEYLGFHNNEPSHYANYENPIILFGDHTCKCKLMCKDFSLGENVVPFCSSDTNFTDIYFLYYAVHKIITTEEYKRHWGRFITLKILVPPIELQRKYSKLVVWFEKEKEVLFKHNLNLIKQRDMLLPRLMSGKLEVK